MTMMKIEPNVVDPSGNFAFGDVTVNSINTSSGKAIDGILEKSYTIPGILKILTGSVRWWIPTNIKLSSIICSVTTAPTGANIILTIKKNGVAATTATLAAGTSTQTTPATLTLVKGDYITVDVSQVGTPVSGSDLVLTFLYYRT